MHWGLSQIMVLQAFWLFWPTLSPAQELHFVTHQFFPFSYYDGDRGVGGPIADIIQEICESNNDQCSMRILHWQSALHFVRTGHSQGIFPVGRKYEREEWLHFTHPVLKTQYGLFVRKDNPLVFISAQDLTGYTIGVAGPSVSSYNLESLQSSEPDIVIDMSPNEEDGFRKLSYGRIQAVYANHDLGRALMKTLTIKGAPIDNIRWAGVHKTENFFIAFSNKKPEYRKLFDDFNDGLWKLRRSGDLQRILEKYDMTPAEIN